MCHGFQIETSILLSETTCFLGRQYGEVAINRVLS